MERQRTGERWKKKGNYLFPICKRNHQGIIQYTKGVNKITCELNARIFWKITVNRYFIGLHYRGVTFFYSLFFPHHTSDWFIWMFWHPWSTQHPYVNSRKHAYVHRIVKLDRFLYKHFQIFCIWGFFFQISSIFFFSSSWNRIFKQNNHTKKCALHSQMNKMSCWKQFEESRRETKKKQTEKASHFQLLCVLAYHKLSVFGTTIFFFNIYMYVRS